MEKNRIQILGMPIDPLTQKEALDRIKLFLSSNKQRQIVTLNSEMIVSAQKDLELGKIINEADLVIADGMGVLRLACFEKQKTQSQIKNLKALFLITIYSIFMPEKVKTILPEKISGIDFIYKILESEFSFGKRIYLIGGRGDTAEIAKSVLEKKYASAKIVGAEEGIAEWGDETENERLIQNINSKSPDIIFVAFGCPKQEKWIYENLHKLPSVKVAMGVGGSLDFISGKISRAPRFLQNHGLEWMWRLLQEPGRIGRIYNATLKASWLIFRSKKDII